MELEKTKATATPIPSILNKTISERIAAYTAINNNKTFVCSEKQVYKWLKQGLEAWSVFAKLTTDLKDLQKQNTKQTAFANMNV